MENQERLTFTVNGVSFDMIHVEGGTFTMGATSEQGSEARDWEKPTHSVTLSSFSVGETEVTQALWEAVMGESVFRRMANRNSWATCGVGSNYPMYYISWNDCQTFISKLNNLLSSQLGGKRFRMPTEAEWEFAARGGNKSKGYKYSGSNKIDNVAWCFNNSYWLAHPVKQKQANELGLYDMSGNVMEWCSDWYSSSYYCSSPNRDPKGSSSGSFRVIRGGCWNFSSFNCRSSTRDYNYPDYRDVNLGLRLALADNENLQDIKNNKSVYSTTTNYIHAKQTFTVNGVSFDMIHVEGGTFTMGALLDDEEAYDDEKPAHSVTLSSYSIGETQVTQALWQAVIGDNPSYFKGDNQRPVEQVSWNDCQDFIRKLNSLTGKNFRLPTEAEWEYAARGGNKSKGYKYIGSNSINNVAWYGGNSGRGWFNLHQQTHPVKQKQANELGLYDMSGNVWEWCQDWYHVNFYRVSPSNNPQGPSCGSFRVYRGGCWGNGARGCRSSYRLKNDPDFWDGGLGFRLALSE